MPKWFLHRRVGKGEKKTNTGDRGIFMFVLLEARLHQQDSGEGAMESFVRGLLSATMQKGGC